MNNELKIEDILKEFREMFGTMAQEVAILKAQLAQLQKNNPDE
jgi:hypothetical protein